MHAKDPVSARATTEGGGEPARVASRKPAPRGEPDSGRATLTIDLAAVAANYALLNGKLAHARLGAVVKAGGYGLGLAQVVRTLARAGCADFFVADLEEGIALRRLTAEARIHVFNGPPPGATAEFAPHRLIPVLNDLGQIALWQAAIRRGRGGPAAIHVDTGMARLGLPPEELEVLANEPARLQGIPLAHVMSHMACADEPDNPMNARQLEAFRATRARLPRAPASLANSSAVFLGPAYHFDLVRSGAALYGLNPCPQGPNPMESVVRLEAPILQVRVVDSPQTVGYGATYRVPRRGRIATVPVGYADGYLCALGGRASAFLGDIRVPVVGRVSMDLITLDVSDVPEQLAVPGATVELIGERRPVDDLAREAGTIGYEILTSLGHRYRRRYVGEAAGPDVG